MLICKKCSQEKLLQEFYKHNEGYLGVMQPCKECKKQYARSPKYREGARKRDYDRYHNNDERRLYVVWSGMRGRCYVKTNHHYKRYGAKGIIIERPSFIEFKKDMLLSYLEHGKKYGFNRKGTQIDRINNNGNYTKDNCRRVTASENVANQSKRK